MDLKPLIYRMERVRAVPATGGANGAGDGGRTSEAGTDGNAVPAFPAMLCGAVEAPAPAIFLRLCTGSTDNIKPELVMETFYTYMGRELLPFAFQAEREEVYAGSDSEEGGSRQREFVPLEALGENIEQTDYHEA